MQRSTILRGCQQRGWQATEVTPGTINAEHRERNVMAAVSIHYDRNHYSIVYRDSAGMRYNEKRQGIHYRYTVWIKNLDSALRKELAGLDAHLRGGHPPTRTVREPPRSCVGTCEFCPSVTAGIDLLRVRG